MAYKCGFEKPYNSAKHAKNATCQAFVEKEGDRCRLHTAEAIEKAFERAQLEISMEIARHDSSLIRKRSELHECEMKLSQSLGALADAKRKLSMIDSWRVESAQMLERAKSILMNPDATEADRAMAETMTNLAREIRIAGGGAAYSDQSNRVRRTGWESAENDRELGAFR